ncbi:MAG: IS256 family transposase [Actinomycetota bacterium]
MEARYLNTIEESRISRTPLPLEIIENVQEAIWLGISSSVRAVLKRLVEMALEDERTERLQATRHERTPERRGHRNGTYTRDLHTTWGPIEDLEVPRVVMPDGSSPGEWQTFDRYERRTYELDRLIGQLFLYGCSARNVERVSKDLWGKKVGRSTTSRVTESFEDEGKAINEGEIPAQIRYLFLDGQAHKMASELGLLDKQLLAAFAILTDGSERLLGYRLGESESEGEWGMLLDDLRKRGLRSVELIVVDGAGGLEAALATRFSDVPIQRCIMHVARNVMAKVRARNKAEVGEDLRSIWDSPDRTTAMANFEVFTTKWIVSEDRAVRCLADKIDRALTFYDFPQEDWSKIRTNNVAERGFRFIRQRQRPIGAFTNEESAERIVGALGGEWNRRRSHPLEAIYTT